MHKNKWQDCNSSRIEMNFGMGVVKLTYLLYSVFLIFSQKRQVYGKGMSDKNCILYSSLQKLFLYFFLGIAISEML